MSTFKVGQRVVCVNDEAGWLDGAKLLKKDEEYTVLEKRIARNGRLEILVHCSDGFWDASRFRPLDELSNTTYNEVMERIESGKPIEILN